jgi:NADH:ubiquinone oxidoreductase subunit K
MILVILFMTIGMSIMGLVDEKNALAAQNILICIEMLLASIMHHLFFPYHEWEEVRTPHHT